MSQPAPDICYISGLDLGQAQDSTALAVLERTTVPDPVAAHRTVHHYAVRHLERFPLGTPYPDVCARLKVLFGPPPLARSALAVDQTGVGRPVVDLLRRARVGACLRPITITAGHKATPDDGGGWCVPKKELVGVLQVLLQARRIKVPPALPEAPTLVQELLAFRVKVTASANETFEAWRERDHDDLVLAVACAAWVGERVTQRLHVWV